MWDEVSSGYGSKDRPGLRKPGGLFGFSLRDGQQIESAAEQGLNGPQATHVRALAPSAGSGLLRQEKKRMSKKLYVGNLSYQTTEATLSELFGAIGEVVSVSIITDNMSGRSKGFGFVEMADENAAQQAISQLNDKVVDERTIKVAEARPQRTDRGRDDRSGDSRERRF